MTRFKKDYFFQNLFIVSFCCLLFSCAFFQKPIRPVFHWPLKQVKWTQKFSASKNSLHLGLDLKADVGTAVFSSHSGRVVYTGNRLSKYGKTVILEYSAHWASLYAHLDTIQVKMGQTVKQGELIGTSGNTGHSTGPHLHFELIYNKKSIDPMIYLQ